MTEEQKYSELLKELGHVMSEKNRTIFYLEYELDSLRKKLAAAESQNIVQLKKAED